MSVGADTQLQEECRLLREHLPLGVIQVDPQGLILSANPVSLSMLDFPSLKAAQALNVLSSPAFLQSEIAPAFERCLQACEPSTSDHAYTSDRGGNAYLRLHLAAVRDKQGKVLSIQAIIEDIGEQLLTDHLLSLYQQRLEETNSELNKLSHAIEQSANIVMITDLGGHIEYVNPKFVEATGYTAEEVLGRNPRLLNSGTQSPAFYEDLWKTILSGKQWQGEFRNQRKDGTLYWEQSSIAPVFTASGQMTHFIAIKEDITKRKEAEEALQRTTERLRILHEIDQSVLAAQLPETIAVAAIHRIRRLIPCQRVTVMALDKEGQASLLAAASDAEIPSITDLGLYQDMLNAPPLGSGIVQGCEDLTAITQPSQLQQMLFDVGMRSYIVVPLFIQNELVGALNLEFAQPKVFTQDHIAIAIEVAVSLAVAIRQARLYEQANQEIAERMQAEQALRQYTVELEARNAELDAFAHTVAHDLRNPVASILGYAEVLKKKYDTLAPGIVGQFLDVIASNSFKMASIIDELLLLASVRGVTEIEMQPLEMGRIVAEARGRLLNLIEERQGQFTLPDSWPVALGHGSWIEAVWTNYISNALKYGGDPPHVVLGATPQADGWVRFWVRDNGPGLSPEEQARLFTPFERLHQTRIEGQGLGLSIVQRIVKKLGGQVGVESDHLPGQGSTFYFNLPTPTEARAETQKDRTDGA